MNATRFELLMRVCAHLHIHVRLEVQQTPAPVVDREAVNALVVLLARAAYARWKRGELLPVSAEA